MYLNNNQNMFQLSFLFAFELHPQYLNKGLKENLLTPTYLTIWNCIDTSAD